MRSIIVGFGRIANSISKDKKIASRFRYASHAQVLKEHPAFEWVGVADPSRQAQKDAKKWDVPVIGELEEVIQKANPEFAVLATPVGTRLDIIKQMPDLKHVLIEKPYGDEGPEILAYCKENNIEPSVNFWRRGVPFYRDFARHQMKQMIGDVQAVFCVTGNGIYNNGSHLIDFLRMLFGNVKGVARIGDAKTLKSVGCSGPLDDYHVSFALEMNGFHIMVQPVDFNHYREVSVDIWGTKGRVGLYHESLSAHLYPKADHRAMERQSEISSDRFAATAPDVSNALYNLYTSISAGVTQSPGINAIEAEKVINAIVRP